MSETSDLPLVTVVIPYFQRQSGILKKCVESIVSQENYSNFNVIVVDDASPVSADSELADILARDSRIRVIRQDNAGPGAARNRGLDNIPADTTYVAFIDSDDWWEKDFLCCAIEALEQGHDLYFANSSRMGFSETRFDWQAKDGLNLDEKSHLCLDETRKLYRFKGDFFDYAIVRSNIISTSALVYRLSCQPQLRFSTRLFNGQDRLFKLMLAQATNKVAFCPRVMVQEETGVNIFDSAKWGTAKSLVLLSNYIKLAKCILQELRLTPTQQAHVKSQLQDSRFSMVASLMHLLKSGDPFDWKVISGTIKADPAFLFCFVPNLFRLLMRRNGGAK
ncbi:glycosyltransferase family 2 protein [Aliiglaciecola sp. CAU 1673]|uniref:glycosyltransferase family 2 protein n=1 Tax=Aliiglaciecola sp. CAU 1673 TaxID=3032595 RepID=UPI0023DA44FF|nr:glycosyltransferase family 2 protein [Aliiglaciecola sp. CAU 1673]MDF2177293.1 glycosyltransferase family 2 protein [Aliiglaciecola sp. CAU 1673]